MSFCIPYNAFWCCDYQSPRQRLSIRRHSLENLSADWMAPGILKWLHFSCLPVVSPRLWQTPEGNWEEHLQWYHFYVASTSQEKKPPQQKCTKAWSVNSSFLNHILYDLCAKTSLEIFAFWSSFNSVTNIIGGPLYFAYLCSLLLSYIYKLPVLTECLHQPAILLNYGPHLTCHLPRLALAIAVSTLYCDKMLLHCLKCAANLSTVSTPTVKSRHKDPYMFLTIYSSQE